MTKDKLKDKCMYILTDTSFLSVQMFILLFFGAMSYVENIMWAVWSLLTIFLSAHYNKNQYKVMVYNNIIAIAFTILFVAIFMAYQTSVPLWLYIISLHLLLWMVGDTREYRTPPFDLCKKCGGYLGCKDNEKFITRQTDYYLKTTGEMFFDACQCNNKQGQSND